MYQSQISSNDINMQSYISAQLSSRKNEILPDMDDVKGAARGIAKLWDRYRYHMSKIRNVACFS